MPTAVPHSCSWAHTATVPTDVFSRHGALWGAADELLDKEG